MDKKCKVVMLPVDKEYNDKGDLCLFDYGLNIAGVSDIGYPPQHLYLVSDEEIREGDWEYDEVIKEINQATSKDRLDFYNKSDSGHFKIIATTDLELVEYCKGVHRLGEGCNLNNKCIYPDCRPAKIPESFVQAYVKAEGKIKNVNVEYEHEMLIGHSPKTTHFNTNPKTTENNEVIIDIEEQTYTFDEVAGFIRQFENQHNIDKEHTYREIAVNKFIKENLQRLVY